MIWRAGVIAALLISAAQAEPLVEARWIAPGADRIAALTQSPGECLVKSKDPDTAYKQEVGRAAFNSPFLLGGQAARGGLSCASCHVDGHSNPDFFLDGLSGAPGAADVSSSIFSKVRDDGVFNPIAIPTLVGIKGKTSFGAAAPAPTLRAFMSSAIVEEFQGAGAEAAVLDGLVAYIEAMDGGACPSAPIAITPKRAMDDVGRTLAAAREAALRDDRATSDFLLVSAQSMLGRIHARFDGGAASDNRAALEKLSADIGALRNGAIAPAGLHSALDEIERRAKRLGKRLQKARRQSLYDPLTLAAHLY